MQVLLVLLKKKVLTYCFVVLQKNVSKFKMHVHSDCFCSLTYCFVALSLPSLSLLLKLSSLFTHLSAMVIVLCDRVLFSLQITLYGPSGPRLWKEAS